MIAKAEFAGLPADFWAYVKALSEKLGYSERGKKSLKRHSTKDVQSCLDTLDLSPEPLSKPLTRRYSCLTGLVAYLNYRAATLEKAVRPRLMNREEAQSEFERLKAKLHPQCALPMNKQKGEKRHEAYLTCIVNMLTEHALGGCHFDDDPRRLITVQRDGRLLITLSRRCIPVRHKPGRAVGVEGVLRDNHLRKSDRRRRVRECTRWPRACWS